MLYYKFNCSKSCEEYQSDEAQKYNDESTNGTHENNVPYRHDTLDSVRSRTTVGRHSAPPPVDDKIPTIYQCECNDSAAMSDDDDKNFSPELNRARRRWLSGYRKVGERLGHAVKLIFFLTYFS